MRFRGSIVFIALVLLEAVPAFNCGQNSPATSNTSTSSNNISITVAPADSSVATGGTEQLSATVTGTTQTRVTWSIATSGSNVGSIDSNGLYHAPSAGLLNSVTIRAASVADPADTAYATIWVLAPGNVSSTNNLLVAKYSMTVPDGAKVKVNFGLDTSYGLDTWFQPAPSGGGLVDILVAGMKMSSTYHMQAVVDLPDGTVFQDADHTFQTGSVPSTRIPQLTVSTPGSLTPSPGVEELVLGNYPAQFSSNNPFQAVVTDLQGNLIWYYDVDPTGVSNLSPFPFKLMDNGHMMVIATQVDGGDGIGGELREVDLAGNIVRSMTAAELDQKLANDGFKSSDGTPLTIAAMHHDFALLPNGHVILLVNHTEDVTLSGSTSPTTVKGDALIDLDKNWNPVWVWDTFGHLNINRHPHGLPDWTHGNAVIYSKDDGNLLFSSRAQSWVIKIDYEDGQGDGHVIWRFGYQGDFALDSGAPAAWMYGQHDIQFLSPNTTGTFTLGAFDNGWYRVLDSSGDECSTTGEPTCYSRVPFFQVDEATKTAHVLWQDTNLDYSEAVGSIESLPNGDVEFDEGFLEESSGIEAQVLEVTKDANPQTVWRLNEYGQVGYRIYRIPSLYPGVQW